MIISNYAIRFRVAVFVFIAVVFVMGTLSYLRLPREGAPDITIPFVYVSAFYEGTAPEEMEKLVTIPLERQLRDLENVKEIQSTSAENLTFLSIEFVAGADIEMARQRVKDKVDLARPDLPDDLDEPVVDAFNFSSDVPVYIFALSGVPDIQRLKALAEDLQDAIELVPGVRSVEIGGVREREVRVAVDLNRLLAYRIPLSTLLARIGGDNVTASVGNIRMADHKFQVRVPGEFTLAAELRDLPIGVSGDRMVYLRDLATVEDTFKDESSRSRINGEPCVSVTLKKRAGVNAVELIERVRRVIAGFALPPEVKLTVVMDQSTYVDMMISELENNIASGFLLVILVLFVVMGWRNSLLVGIAIPLSMLVSFVLMEWMGYTLNMIVLFSLVLAVGMLVDNAIVIVENTYRLRCGGSTRREAARQGAAEVAWPVITSTLTTVLAFVPLLVWPDIMGQFMGFMPRALIVVLSASLFVAIVMNPAVCSVFIRRGGRRSEQPGAVHPFLRAYERLLRAALRRRVAVLLLGVVTMALTVVLYARFGRGQELFPEIDPRNATINVTFPQGTSLERTDAVLRRIEALLPRHRDIKFFLTSTGAASSMAMFAGGAQGTHRGSIHVEFRDAADREGSTIDLVDAMRREIGQEPGAEITVEREREGPPTGAPVSIDIIGDDFSVLAQLAADVRRMVETVPGLVDVRDDLEEALPELQFRVNRRRAHLLGLDTGQIAAMLRTAIYGTAGSKLRVDEEEYDISVILAEDQRNDLDLLNRMQAPLPDGSVAPLSAVGTVCYTGGRGAITRKDEKRVVSVSGNNQGRGVDEILRDVKGRLAELRLPRGYAIRYRGDTEEMQESMAFLTNALGVALALITVILVLQFNSALLPLIILFSVMLSFVGVMWGLLICRMKFGVIMTGVGCISLAGVVVNNSIVLVDCMRRLQADGMEHGESVVAAGKLRIRPVLLTAVTTVLGLIPMAIGYSLEVHTWPPRITAGAESSAWWAPMAVAVIFGLSVATALTLVLVPVMCSLADSLSQAFRRRFAAAED